jgi:hypothetical protein
MNFKLLALLAVLAVPVMADPGGNACNIHPDAPFCGGGEGGGGTNGEPTGANTNENSNTNSSEAESNSSSDSESSSNASSGSYAGGGSVRNSNDISTRGGDASSTASGGDASASGGTGGVGIGGQGGEASASSGGNTQDISVEGDSLTDNSVLIYEDAKNTASSAASVFAGYCQTGASGQIGAGGFSVVNPEAFCNNVRMAGVYQEAYMWELSHGKLTCSETAGSDWVDNQYADTCVNEQAATYYKLYNWHLDEAHELLESTKGVAKVDAYAGYLIRPAALIALLFLL